METHKSVKSMQSDAVLFAIGGKKTGFSKFYFQILDMIRIYMGIFRRLPKACLFYDSPFNVILKHGDTPQLVEVRRPPWTDCDRSVIRDCLSYADKKLIFQQPPNSRSIKWTNSNEEGLKGKSWDPRDDGCGWRPAKQFPCFGISIKLLHIILGAIIAT